MTIELTESEVSLLIAALRAYKPLTHYARKAVTKLIERLHLSV